MRTLSLIFVFAGDVGVYGVHGPTSLTDDLNGRIKVSPNFNPNDRSTVYRGGKGILVRSAFDGYQDDPTKKSVPATFWVNDIFAPSQLYPGSGAGAGNPWCPTQSAPWHCDTDQVTGDWGPYNYVQMAFVVGSKMDQIYPEFSKIQTDDWGWGVFYPTDSNAVDQRCSRLDILKGWDCPGGFLADDGTFTADDMFVGSGFYEAGNPDADLSKGGGAGCHFDKSQSIDQTNTPSPNLMQDGNCQCNYADFNSDWSRWVDHWAQNVGQGPSWMLDIAACWMNNPRDMILLQNQLWWKKDQWSDQTVPLAVYNAESASANRPYWGWNEVPISRSQAGVDNWDAVMLKLPAAVCGSQGVNDRLSCVPIMYHQQLEADIDLWVKSQYLELGKGNFDTKPGSSIVLAREWMDDNNNYLRDFFCESWTSPQGLYEIVYDQGDRLCYLQTPAVVA